MANKLKYDIRSAVSEHTADGGNRIHGKCICFNERTLIGGEFYEVIESGAINYDTLKDVCLLVNHEQSQIPLARTRNGSLEFDIRADGIYFSAMLNPNMSISSDLYHAIESGLITQCSFAFADVEERWDFTDKLPTRTIKKIGYLPEVSLVNVPAYEGTNVSTRTKESFDEARREKIKAEIRQKFEQKRKDELKAQISERLRKEK